MLFPGERWCRFVHMGHWKEAGGSPRYWPVWAAGSGRSQPHWDLQGWAQCFEVVVLSSAPMYLLVASLNWFTGFIRCGMSGIL